MRIKPKIRTRTRIRTKPTRSDTGGTGILPVRKALAFVPLAAYDTGRLPVQRESCSDLAHTSRCSPFWRRSCSAWWRRRSSRRSRGRRGHCRPRRNRAADPIRPIRVRMRPPIRPLVRPLIRRRRSRRPSTPVMSGRKRSPTPNRKRGRPAAEFEAGFGRRRRHEGLSNVNAGKTTEQAPWSCLPILRWIAGCSAMKKPSEQAPWACFSIPCWAARCRASRRRQFSRRDRRCCARPIHSGDGLAGRFASCFFR